MKTESFQNEEDANTALCAHYISRKTPFSLPLKLNNGILKVKQASLDRSGDKNISQLLPLRNSALSNTNLDTNHTGLSSLLQPQHTRYLSAWKDGDEGGWAVQQAPPSTAHTTQAGWRHWRQNTQSLTKGLSTCIVYSFRNIQQAYIYTRLPTFSATGSKEVEELHLVWMVT